MNTTQRRTAWIGGCAVAALVTALVPAYAGPAVTNTAIAAEPTIVRTGFDAVLDVKSPPGQANHLSLGITDNELRVRQASGQPVTIIGPHCRQHGPSEATCNKSAIHSYTANTGDGDDLFSSSVDVPGKVDTGAGNDAVTDLDPANGEIYRLGDGDDVYLASPALGSDDVFGGPGSDQVSYSPRGHNVNIDLDGVPDDGEVTPTGLPIERDNIEPDFEKIIGGSGNDTLVGNASANVLVGLNGDDLLVGNGGNDLIQAGIGSSFADQINGSDVMSGGAGIDTVSYSTRSAGLLVSLDDVRNDGAFSEGDNVKSDVENLLGGSGKDTLTGSAATNNLRGLSGNDTIHAGGGNDLVEGGSGTDVLFGEGGTDTATYKTHPVGVAVSLDSKANDGRSNEADNVAGDFENVIGTNFDDTVLGNNAANQLQGLAGNDRLFGRPGNDRLIGDSGFDQGFGDAGTDTCTTETKTSCP